MTQPFYLPTLATIPGKPNVIRAGLPVTSGSVVNGQTQPGPAAGYLTADPLINLGTTACYLFSNQYCYPGAVAQTPPGLNQPIALDLANNQHTCQTALGSIQYGNGGFKFTATNATDGSANPAPQGILFNPLDLVPTAQAQDGFVSTIWVGTPQGSFVGAINALIFSYPDGSTWSLVAGVWTFKPVGQAAIAIPAAQTVWNASQPLQLGYSISNIAVGSYTVSVYVNGQKSSSVNYAVSYAPPASPVGWVGFGPDATAAADLYAYTCLRFYMEDTTISGNSPDVVVAADYLFNYTDLLSVLSNNLLPTAPFLGTNPAQASVVTPSPTASTPAPVSVAGADGTTAAFTASTNILTATFTDTSVPTSGTTITGWAWTFGDGTGTSTVQNPSYTYASSGAFVVTLTVTDSNGQTAVFSGNVIVASA